jgi:hypothetical protein
MGKEKPPSYYYIGEKDPASKIKTIIPSAKKKSNSEKDLFNPLFNLDKNFGNNFAEVLATDLAQSVPYISIEIINLDSKKIDNLNVDFFHKQIDFDKIKGAGRYNDRPLISLNKVTITTDQSTGGYLYYTKVQLDLKIHKKDELSDRAILGLLFPGCPIRMEYGWQNNLRTKGGEFLNKSRQTILMNVVSYDISLDETGQADLIVNCMAFNDLFDNVIIGDLTTIKKSNDNVGEKEGDGLALQYDQVTRIIEYLESLSGEGKKNVNDYKMVTDQLSAYRNLQKRSEGKISQNFTKYMESLADKKLKDELFFGRKKTKVEVVTFHDLLFTLCDETFKSLTALIPVSKFEVVYGSFNDQCLEYSGKSIAEFPIDYNKFVRWIGEMSANGQKTIYVKDLIDSLCRNFIQNEEYLRQTSKSAGKTFLEPDIVVSLTNTGDTMYLHIADANANIPPTSNQIKDLKKASLKEAEDKILNGTDIPTLTLGNANSFIKGVNFSRIDDAYMESVLIERSLSNSMATPRSSLTNSALETGQAVDTPLNLPLQGTARVAGHVAWKPFRAFYLSTGIFLIDAIYIIKKVTHVLSNEGFETQIEFMWH